MTFKGTLFTPIKFTLDNQPPDKYYLEFTKSQIIVPEKFKDVSYENSEIKDRANYKLQVYDNIDMRYRYEITIGNSQPIRLWVNKIEEKKLKKVHGLSKLSGIPVKWELTKIFIASAMSLVVSILVILINIQSTSRKFEAQKILIDSLTERIVLLEKGLEYKAALPLKIDTPALEQKSDDKNIKTKE